MTTITKGTLLRCGGRTFEATSEPRMAVNVFDEQVQVVSWRLWTGYEWHYGQGEVSAFTVEPSPREGLEATMQRAEVGRAFMYSQFAAAMFLGNRELEDRAFNALFVYHHIWRALRPRALALPAPGRA